MTRRISPLWWPAIALASPVLLPALYFRNRSFNKDISHVRSLNRKRINNASLIELPELEHLEMAILLEEKKQPGYKSAPGISYHLKTDRGSLLFDLGYGDENTALSYNAEKMRFSLKQVDAVAISHLHPDHMGGFKAVRENRIGLPVKLGTPNGMKCFLPEYADTPDFDAQIIKTPQLIPGGFATTGPLARSLFLMGRTEEQTLVCHLKGKGLVVITGCGHPTIQKILEMVAQISKTPVYAIIGGLHLPVTDSPLKKPGFKVQMIWGTGKPPWKKIKKQDLDRTIEVLNQIGMKKLFLSHHDCCNYSAERINNEVDAEVTILKSGTVYSV